MLELYVMVRRTWRITNQVNENTCINLLGVVGMLYFLEANQEVSIAWVPLIKKPMGFFFFLDLCSSRTFCSAR